MKNRKRKNTIMVLLVLLLTVTIGFAALATTLKINGSASITKNNWSVYWDEESIAVTQGSKGDTIPDVVNGEDGSINTKVNWNVILELPGDFYEFTIDAVNAGTIDAMITGITSTLPQDLPSYVSYSVTYADGIEPAVNHLLPKGTKSGSTITPTTEKYKVRIEFKDTITPEQMDAIPEDGLSFDFGYEVQYGQATDDAIQKPSEANFATDSWDKIIAAYKGGALTQLTTDMNNGTTREVELDLDNDGTAETTAHLRIANLSTPAECSTEGFSQTACGFVIEFADIITTHQMNPYTNGTVNGDGNKGGWEYSEMRTYLNTDIYNALPNDLRSKIKDDTTVVSGHGSNDTDNFTTTDKIYLLDAKEIYGDSFTIDYNTSKDSERQLDYYANLGVTISAIKKDLSGENYYWWLRSANSINSFLFFNVLVDGFCGCDLTNAALGVSPAFRIA